MFRTNGAMPRYLPLLFCAVTICGFYRLWPGGQSTPPPATPKIAGLDELLDGEPFHLLNGDSSLEFFEGRKVTLVQNAKEESKTPERRAEGEWSLEKIKSGIGFQSMAALSDIGWLSPMLPRPAFLPVASH
jgi:hypothetical protein